MKWAAPALHGARTNADKTIQLQSIRINQRIRANEVRLVLASTGEPLGVLRITAAPRKAQELGLARVDVPGTPRPGARGRGCAAAGGPVKGDGLAVAQRGRGGAGSGGGAVRHRQAFDLKALRARRRRRDVGANMEGEGPEGNQGLANGERDRL
mgnify:CR=1 FL=1